MKTKISFISTLTLLSLVAVVAVIFQYYFPNFEWKSAVKILIGPVFGLLWLSRLSDLLVALFLVFGTYSAAKIVFARLLKITFSGSLEEFLYCFAAGIGMLALSLFSLVALHIVYPWALGLISLAMVYCVWLTRMSIKQIVKDVRDLFKIGSEPVSKWIWYSLVTYLSASLLIVFIASLTPPLEIDSLFYHLEDPRLYLSSHGFVFSPSQMNLMPENLEMIYMLGMFLKSAVAAKVFHFLLGAILVIAMMHYSGKFLNKLTGLVAGCLLISMPVVAYDMGLTVSNDMGIALFCFLIIISLYRWSESSDSKWLFASFMLLGISLGIKHTSVFFIPFMLYFIADTLYRKQQKTLPVVFLNIAKGFLLSLAIASPWYVKSYLICGNPAWPMFPNFFHGPMNDIALSFAISQKNMFGIWKIGEWYKIPWNMSFGSGEKSDGVIGPMIWLLLPLLVFWRPKGLLPRMFLIFFVSVFAIWLFQSQLVRYSIFVYSPLIVCLSASLVYGWGTLASKVQRLAGIVFYFALGVMLVFMFPLFHHMWHEPQRYSPVMAKIPGPIATTVNGKFSLFDMLLGQADDEYLNRYLDSYPIVKYINKNLSDNSKTFYFGGGPPYYYCKKNVVWYERALDMDGLKSIWDSVNFVTYMRNKGFTHVLFEATEPQNHWLSVLDSRFVQDNFLLETSKNNYLLYRVLPDRMESKLSNHIQFDLLSHEQALRIDLPSREGGNDPSRYEAVLNIDDDVRRCLIMKGNCRVMFSGQIPYHGILGFGFGKVFQDMGDGGNFEIEAKVDSVSVPLFRRYLNPKDNIEDRGWKEMSIDLSSYHGKEVTFTFKTDAGPKNDGIADWFAWSNPIIIEVPKYEIAEDLLTNFAKASISPRLSEGSAGKKLVFLFDASRHGEVKHSFVTTAGSRANFSIESENRPSLLVFDLAMVHPQGDGAVAEIYFVHDGFEEKIFSESLKPKPFDDQQDPGWSHFTVDLEPVVSKNGILSFRCSAGPKGDAIADWVAWAEPKILEAQ